MEKIKIMIAEDHTMFRNTLVEDLATENIEVIGAAQNGKELIELTSKNIPDVVVLDLKMPIMSGQDVLKVFARDFKTIRTIVFSMDYTSYLVADTILNGAAAYLAKNADIAKLIEAIEGVYRDGYYFNELISKTILEELRNDKKKLYYLIENKRFSEKEIQVLKLLCDEVPIAKIADILNISTNTVLHHKKTLFKKTESATIVSLVKYAIHQGIVSNNNNKLPE